MVELPDRNKLYFYLTGHIEALFVSIEQIRLINECHPHLVPSIFDLVPHISYDSKITIFLPATAINLVVELQKIWKQTERKKIR